MSTDNPNYETPKHGDPLSHDDVKEIFAAIQQRQENFPGEPALISATLVMLNIGARYSHVSCVNGEWEGFLVDVPKQGSQTPLCPNGHPMVKHDNGLRLEWRLEE